MCGSTNGQNHTVIVKISTLVIGIALLAFGISDLLMPRARFVSASPPAGAILADIPSSVTLEFTKKLAPESSMDVTSTIRLLPSGEMEYLNGSSVVSSSGLDPGDVNGQSMRADLRPDLHKGLYFVSWRTTAASWGTVTYGKTYFAVGMRAPDSVTSEMKATFSEHNYQWRSRRAALVGGVILSLLGLYLWIKKPTRLSR